MPSTSKVSGGRSSSSTPRAASVPVSRSRSARSPKSCSASITIAEPAKRVLRSIVVIGRHPLFGAAAAAAVGTAPLRAMARSSTPR